MKARDTALRTRRHNVDEKARKVADLERIIREFDVMAADLDRQIQAEEDRTGIRDQTHFSYSTYAKAAAQRRDNLRTSTEALRDQLAAAVREHDDAAEQFARASAQMEARDDLRPNRRRPERLAAAALR
ncbi:MAG: flagellar export protein FliJ [Hyphomicrobium sp.]